MMRLTLGAVIVSALLAAGCDDRDNEVRYREVEREHVCDVNCHHHYYDEHKVTYVTVDKHRHGPGCGHEWNGDRWVVIRRTVARPSGHHCTVDCRDHHYHEGRQVVQKGHVHGRGCGHRYDGHRWVSVRVVGRR